MVFGSNTNPIYFRTAKLRNDECEEFLEGKVLQIPLAFQTQRSLYQPILSKCSREFLNSTY